MQVDRATWWEGKFYPDAGEVIGWRCVEDVPKSWPAPLGPFGTLVGGGESPVPLAGSAAAVREGESNRQRASRRARTRLRRYAVANRLRYLWVLTFAPVEGVQEFDLAVVKRRVAEWVKRGLRDAVGYEGAYVVGFERHKSGAWHVNVLLGSFVEHRSVEVSWGRGNVWVSRFEGRKGESMRDAARRAAAYVAKYVAKEFDEEAGRGTHRYEVAQGFTVREVRVFALSASGILEECGGTVLYRYDAPAAESGRGPPIVWAAIGD